MGYKCRVPTSLLCSLSLLPKKLNYYADQNYLGRPQVIAHIKNPYGAPEWEMDHIIMAQNRSTYLYLRNNSKCSVMRILSNLILYGMYAWIADLSTNGTILRILDPYDQSILLSNALRVRDPIMIELLLQNDARITHNAITGAMNWYPCGDVYPGYEPGFNNQAEEREYLIEVQREIAALLTPLSAKYKIEPKYMVVDMNPRLHGGYGN